MPWLRRFSASGSPPWRASLRFDERLLPGLGQRDQGKAAESEFTAAAADQEALNPAAGSAGLDKEVQSVSIGVSSGRSRADEGSREGLLGMAALGFGFG